MSKVENRRERYMRDSAQIRLGGIAANLARVSSFSSDPLHKEAVLSLLEESKWFIEWTGPTESVENAARLVEIQVALARFEREFRQGTMGLLDMAVPAAEWSDEILAMSGLLD